MKLYLLDINTSMVEKWKFYFHHLLHDDNIEIVNDDFKHFMDTHLDIDGIVSPANSFGLMDGGYDKAIIDYLGKQAQINVLTMIDSAYKRYQPIGTCLPVVFNKYTILHTPTMRTPEEIIDSRVIFDCMYSCLVKAKQLDLKNIVVPAFGGCTGGVQKDIIARNMAYAYMVFSGEYENMSCWDSAIDIAYTLQRINGLR